MSEESENEPEDVPSMEDNTSVHGRERERAKWYVPLNSTRVTAGQLRDLGARLEVPMSSSIGDLRVMIEAKLRAMDHEPGNVQVALSRDPEDTTVSLLDESGVFLVVEHRHEVPTEVSEPTRSSDALPTPEPTATDSASALLQEKARLQERIDTLTEENGTLHEEIRTLREALDSSKVRIKEIWKLSCGQVTEFDEVLAARDAEISQLKSQLIARRGTRATSSSGTSSIPDTVLVPTVIPDTVSVPTVTGSTTTREARRGRAPPINLFSGEDPEIHLDDWLPSLRQASQ